MTLLKTSCDAVLAVDVAGVPDDAMLAPLSALLTTQRSLLREQARHLCVRCNEPVGGRYRRFQDDIYHVGCFCCSLCQQPVTQQTFLLLGDLPLCTDCSPRCRACGEAIVQDHVNAYDADYHRACLSCVTCGRLLHAQGKVYTRPEGPCCPFCVQTVFEHRWSAGRLTTLDDAAANAALSREAFLRIEEDCKSDTVSELYAELMATHPKPPRPPPHR